VHTLLEAAAVSDEVEPEAGPLPLGSGLGVGEPDRWHQITASELGEHPGVDPIGLAGQRRRPFHLDCVGDLDLPAGRFELVVDKAGAVHRLDRCQHRLAETIDASGERA
jgi:hypothetical protein